MKALFCCVVLCFCHINRCLVPLYFLDKWFIFLDILRKWFISKWFPYYCSSIIQTCYLKYPYTSVSLSLIQWKRNIFLFLCTCMTSCFGEPALLLCVCSLTESCSTLWNSMTCRLPGSSVQRIFHCPFLWQEYHNELQCPTPETNSGSNPGLWHLLHW